MAPRRHGVAHRRRHAHRIVGLGDSGIQEHGGGAKLHGDDRVGGRPDAGIDDDRNTGAAADQFEIGRIGDPHAGTDQRAHRHYGGGAGIDKTLAYDRIVGAVRQHHEAIIDQPARSSRSSVTSG